MLDGQCGDLIASYKSRRNNVLSTLLTTPLRARIVVVHLRQTSADLAEEFSTALQFAWA